MKIRLLILTITTTILVCCSNKRQNLTKVSADELVAKIENYCDNRVETEGTIVHICGVNKKKMKLITTNGSTIKIVPQDTLACFDRSLYKKKIKVSGIVKEQRIGKKHIDKLGKEKTILCHIDHSPCTDSAWVEKKIKNGGADGISEKAINKLNTTMQETQKKLRFGGYHLCRQMGNC